MARPVVKWVGGKGKLVEVLLSHLPDQIDTYYEPFCGGAALFFALSSESPKRYRRAILSDGNEELIAMYRAVRDDLSGVVARLRTYRYDRDLFYQVRDERNAEALSKKKASDTDRGARLIFLNKTCFNGLWRVNSKGEFNVPFGRYSNPTILDEPRLVEASKALQGVVLRVNDFAASCKKAKRGDFVYFDPPYVPVSATANFTAYASSGFEFPDQERLRDVLIALHERGVGVALSNADSKETRKLYRGLELHNVRVARSINSDTKRRGAVGELIVTGKSA